MKQNLILAGVGGQGILTIAQAISMAALKRDLCIKQAEVHGMSQRGGAVQSHLRISNTTIGSDLVPEGQADIIIAVEPLEALRYLHYLRKEGVLITNINAFINIGNYPPVEDLLKRVAEQPQHVMINAEKIARAAGSGRSANIVMLGVASLFLELDVQKLEDAVVDMFAAKGKKVQDVNRRAFHFGRNAGSAYLDGLRRGGSSKAVRHWLDSLSSEHLAQSERPDGPIFDVQTDDQVLSGAEAHAVEETLQQVYNEGRIQLFEHEVYSIIQLIGGISPPHHVFVTSEEILPESLLTQFPGDRVVLKIVSPDIVHKSDVKGVVFVNKNIEQVRVEIDRLIARYKDTADIKGVLVVECVESQQTGFGSELFVGIRSTREFGPVVAAGLGGVNTEYFAHHMKPGIAVAKSIATDTTAEEFLELFKKTAAYDVLSGQTRGLDRMVSDGELLRCFRAFILLAQRFCVDRGEKGPDVAELEVNPFAFHRQQLIPLDGRGRLETAPKAMPGRPISKIDSLLEPKSIAILGVSAKAMNFGRIILNNVIDSGFPKKQMLIIKPGSDQIDGIHCIPSVHELEHTVDLMVVAAGAKQLPALLSDIINCEKIESCILIPGGVGETEGSEEIMNQVRKEIARARAKGDKGPIFLGPNSLGVLSRPGGYDTFFIPANKLDKRFSVPARPVALISQSGAFIVSRLSNLDVLDPAFAISIGNQLDLTPSDLLAAIGKRKDIHTIGIYAEGFKNLDGLSLVRTISELKETGKDIVFFKAGRTEQGQSAAAGHTAAVAGDYDICASAAAHAGAMVTDTFKEFEQLIEVSTALHRKTVKGVNIGGISNAGFETVGMADSIKGARYSVEMATLLPESTEKLAKFLKELHLDQLVNARNPLDLTPMASEQAYRAAIEVMMEADEIDAIVVSVVPLTAALLTTPEELETPGSLADILPELFERSSKPMVTVIDSGTRYNLLARKLRIAGIPVFRTADQAIRSLGRYLQHKNPA